MGGVMTRRIGVRSMDATAAAYFAAMSTAPDATRKLLLNDLIAGLKSDGVWAKLDWLSVMAAHHEQAARLNAVNPAQVMTLNGTPVFTTDVGYTGSSGNYLLTGWDPATNGIQFAQDNACMLGWVYDNVSENAAFMGSANCRMTPRNTVDQAVLRANTTSNQNVSGVTNGSGLIGWDRDSSTTGAGYRNGASIGAIGTTSAALTTDDFQILSVVSSTFTSRTAAAVAWGAHLTAGGHLALYNRLLAYMDAVGVV